VNLQKEIHQQIVTDLLKGPGKLHIRGVAAPYGMMVKAPGSDSEYRIGTDRELSANFDRESSATQVERAVSGDVGAHVKAPRHAVRCAEQRRTQDVA
jgi:hypothetical protein